MNSSELAELIHLEFENMSKLEIEVKNILLESKTDQPTLRTITAFI